MKAKQTLFLLLVISLTTLFVGFSQASTSTPETIPKHTYTQKTFTHFAEINKAIDQNHNAIISLNQPVSNDDWTFQVTKANIANAFYGNNMADNCLLVFINITNNGDVTKIPYRNLEFEVRNKVTGQVYPTDQNGMIAVHMYNGSFLGIYDDPWYLSNIEPNTTLKHILYVFPIPNTAKLNELYLVETKSNTNAPLIQLWQ